MEKDPVRAAIRSMDQGPFRQSSGGFRPTEASVEVINEFGDPTLIGKCHRQCWYRLKGYERTETLEDNTFVLWEVGKAMEEALQMHWNRMGILIDGNVRLGGNIADEGEVEIVMSGEVDALIRDYEPDDRGKPVTIHTDKGIGIECKTVRGYGARKIMGGKKQLYKNGLPKWEAVLQTAMYLRNRKKLEDYYGIKIDYFIITYVAVDMSTFKSFIVRLEDGYSGRIIVTDIHGNELTPSMEYALHKGVDVEKIQGMTIEEIIRRYRVLQDKLESDEPPEREFDLRYSDAKAKRLFETGMMSKTAYKRFTDNELAEEGDWQCRYCDFKSECLPLGVLSSAVDDGQLTEAEAMDMMGYGGIALPVAKTPKKVKMTDDEIIDAALSKTGEGEVDNVNPSE